MVCIRRLDGHSQRTLNLQPLKFCKREELVSNTPAKQARVVPKEAWKLVMVAWNGNHSIPLRKEDPHITTFITPWGSFRYLRNPQGFVDNTIFWDGDLFIDFLETMGRSGIVLNPEKFQFCGQ